MPCGSDTIDGGGSAWTDMVSICCDYDAGGWLVVTSNREKRQALACCVILFTRFPAQQPTTNRSKTLGRRRHADPRPRNPAASCSKLIVDCATFIFRVLLFAGSHSMSLTFKLASLVIRTVAKPIGVCNLHSFPIQPQL